TVRGPDVFVYDKGRPYDQLNRKYSDEPPQLVAEVLSPNDKWGQVLRRVTEFLRRGTAVVWVVVPEHRSVSVRHPDQLPQVLQETGELTGSPAFDDVRFKADDVCFTPEE